MTKKTIGITSATITGLKKDVHYFDAKCFWAWDICFEKHPLFTFDNLTFLYMGKTKVEAIETHKNIKSAFDVLNINDKDRVAVIYDAADCHVIAIGKNYHDSWIDVTDHYKIKSFKQLNLEFDNLVVAYN